MMLLSRETRRTRRWIAYWNAYWFPEATPQRLAVCRIIMVAAQLVLFLPSLGHQLNLLARNTDFIDPQFLMLAITALVPREVFFSPAVFTVLHWVTIIAGITALIGFFTRTSAFVFAAGNWIFVAHAYSYGEEHHTEAILCIFLMLLAFSPSGGRLSIDALLRRWRQRGNDDLPFHSDRVETAIWPLRLTQALLALAYFSTGLSKLVYGGFDWLNGYTLQQYMLQDALVRNVPLGLWLAQQHALCVALSIFTVLFELFFFVALIIPKTVPYILISGVAFHVGLLVTMAVPFFQHVILYAVFIEFEHWKTWKWMSLAVTFFLLKIILYSLLR
jgi:uncharacterized membrane protein YphA (DoxX/SURF4 family)